MTIQTWDKCKNCGGEYGIHHWQTQQCPFGGVEAGPNRPDAWTDSTFEVDKASELDELKGRVLSLEHLVRALLDAVPSAKVTK